MIKIFMEGCRWERGSSERCLKSGVLEVGVIKASFQKHLKTGVKVKVAHRGRGILKVSPPLPPPENFNHTLNNW